MKNCMKYLLLLPLLLLAACSDDDITAGKAAASADIADQVKSMLQREDGTWIGIAGDDPQTQVLAMAYATADEPAKLAMDFYRLLIAGELSWDSLSGEPDAWETVEESFGEEVSTTDGKGTVSLEGTKVMRKDGTWATLTLDIPGLDLKQIVFAGEEYIRECMDGNEAEWRSVGLGCSWTGNPIEFIPKDSEGNYLLELEGKKTLGKIICTKQLYSDENGDSGYDFPLTDEEMHELVWLVKTDKNGQPVTKPTFDEAALKAVMRVTRGISSGFWEYKGKKVPEVVFFNMIFLRELKRLGVNIEKYSKGNEDILLPTLKYNKGGITEYHRLQRAMKINEVAAAHAATWGAFNVLGIDYEMCAELPNGKYPDVENTLDTFLSRAHESFYMQTRLFVLTLYNYKPLLEAVNKKDWKYIAFSYWGPNHKDAESYYKKAYDWYLKNSGDSTYTGELYNGE